VNQVVVGIISRNKNKNKKYLLVSSRKNFGKYTNFYYPPGGHLEKDEDEKVALIREIKEELDINVTPLKKIAETPGDVKNQITHWWICVANISKMKLNTEELYDFRWFTRKEIINHENVWPATKNIFKEYILD
jgi:8-oxo-dGTP diphosphatase